MDFERRTTTVNTTTNTPASSDLFLCFTSRLSSSSSSMKITSKSILSPGRTDKQISLSASLSRRLRTNTSIKGGQSPMFPTGSKKRGSGFENTEPTSPKVTCIGQVRVKTKKKQGMKMRSMSKRIGSSGEASFRRIEQKLDHHHQHQQQHSVFLQSNNVQQQEQRNQKWVHLPLTICEALRAFGAEFNCFLPCRSSCMMSSPEQKEREKINGSLIEENESSTRSCGAVFARWFVAYEEGEGRSRNIELVVGGEEEEEPERRSYHRRRVMEDIDAEKIGVVEEGRVSICVPPKNALLLMRCRSDPVKVAALASRFWESPEEDEFVDHGNEQEKQDVEEEEEDNEVIEKEETLEVVFETEHEECDKFEELITHEAEEELVVSENTSILPMEDDDRADSNTIFHEIGQLQDEIAETQEENAGEELVNEVSEMVATALIREDNGEEMVEVKEMVETELIKEEDGEEFVKSNEIFATELMNFSSPETQLDLEIDENKKINPELIQDIDDAYEEDELHKANTQTSVSPMSEEEANHEIEAQADIEAETTTINSSEEEEEEEEETEELTMETITNQRCEPEFHESSVKEVKIVRENRSTTLPDCLLLMMCEPKLSMEVSKETWVCSTDFIRCVPSSEKRKIPKSNSKDELKKRVSIDSNRNSHLKPPRSSCSFPTAVAAAASGHGVSIAAMIEQKLGNSVAYEPFVLTRCKSAPIKPSAKFAQPEACYWNNRKLEPHCGAALGVGAAGF